MLSLAVLGLTSRSAEAGDFTDAKKLAALEKKVGAKAISVLDPCVEPAAGADPCARHALDGVRSKLRASKDQPGPIRILHLGDSHIAADLITGMIRDRLQASYGDAGRGFIHIDQLAGYGGRRSSKGEADWDRDRIVDSADKAGRPYGFSGAALESKKKGAKITLELHKGEAAVQVYYVPQAEAPEVVAKVGGKEIGRFKASEGQSARLALPPIKGKKGELVIEALGPKARIVGVSFEGSTPGLFYDAIGPVGADAQVYNQLDKGSFAEQIKALDPALVILQVGGNDALKSRKGWTNLEQVEKDHVDLIKLIKTTAPNAACLLFGPMDAGEKAKGKVTSKALLVETRDMQKKLAEQLGCGFWDALEAMGGTGSISKWDGAKVMNADLVHPKKPAGDLLGRLFADAFLAAMK